MKTTQIGQCTYFQYDTEKKQTCMYMSKIIIIIIKIISKMFNS